MSDSESNQLAPSEAGAAQLPRYGLRAGTFLLLADSEVSVQVVDVPRMCPFPNAPPGFRGVVNLRGDLVPVYDLGVLAGEPPAERGKLAVCGDGSERAGLLVAGMPERIGGGELEHEVFSDAQRLPRAISQALRGAGRHDGNLWLEVDYDMLFRNLAEPMEASVARTRVADAHSDPDHAEVGT